MRFRVICREHLLPKVGSVSFLCRFLISQWQLGKMELNLDFKQRLKWTCSETETVAVVRVSTSVHAV